MGYNPYQLIAVKVEGLNLTRTAPPMKKPMRCKLGIHTLREFELSQAQQSEINFGRLKYCVYCDHTE